MVWSSFFLDDIPSKSSEEVYLSRKLRKSSSVSAQPIPWAVPVKCGEVVPNFL